MFFLSFNVDASFVCEVQRLKKITARLNEIYGKVERFFLTLTDTCKTDNYGVDTINLSKVIFAEFPVKVKVVGINMAKRIACGWYRKLLSF